MAKRRRNERPPTRVARAATSGTNAGQRPGGSPAPRSLRDRLIPGRTPIAVGRQRRVSRREREDRRQRQIIWGMAVAGVLVVLILSGTAIYEYLVKPRQVVASVNGTDIHRRDYWKVRSYDLINQASQFQQLASFTSDSSQQQQYQSLAQQALTELKDVWGSKGLDNTSLSKMIDDQLYLKNLESLGLSISDQDIDNYINQQFEPSNAPIFTPTATATLIPTRAAWATETAVAQTAAAGSGAATPEAEGTPEASPVGGGTPVASPTATQRSLPAVEAPNASPAGSPGADASPMTESSPAATLEASATVSPTPNQEQALQTAEAGYGQFRDNVFGETHLSRSDYERLIVRPAVARQKVREKIESEVGQSADQVHATHILVGTKDLADSLYQQLQQPDANFEQLAKDNSTDTATAPNGGDLGWFPHGIMVPAFDEVVFATAAGSISQPFPTEFGWHIVKVYETEANRALTDDMISQLKSGNVQKWLADRRAEAKIKSDLKETPTPATSEFEPPPDAPPTPTPTPTTIASPEGSPAASPPAP